MLILEGNLLWFVAVVIVIAVSSMIALFTRDASAGEQAKPLVLSQEERFSLEAMALALRKRAPQGKNSQGKKKRRRAARGDADGSEE